MVEERNVLQIKLDLLIFFKTPKVSERLKLKSDYTYLGWSIKASARGLSTPVFVGLS